MAAKVKLVVTSNWRTPKEYVFTGRTMCTVGRADDCYLRMPNNWSHLNVSRHHCVFDIDPPHVHVRDLGSRNGTYVNGRKIGQRQRGRGADSVHLDKMPDVALDNGDEVRIGNAFVRVGTDTGSSRTEREAAV